MVEVSYLPNKIFCCKNEFMVIKIYEPNHEETCLMLYANNKGADQPTHARSLISAFVVRCLDSIIPTCTLAIFQDSR